MKSAESRIAAAARAATTPLGTLAVAAVAAAACGTLVHRHGFVVLAALASTAAVGLGWPWLTLRPVRAALAFDADRGREGEPARYRVALTNRGPLPAAGLTLTGLGGRPVPLPRVGPFRTVDLTLVFVPPQRGAHPADTVRVTCGLPFGLWHPGRAVRVDRDLLAWPAAVAVELPADLQGRRSRASAVAATTRPDLLGDEAHGVRPYRRGDAVRRIHHAQTARHDRLIVRELAGAARPAVRLAVDSAAASYAGGRERAIRTAAGLAAACAAAGVDADAIVEGRVVRAGRDTLDALARIGPAGGPAAAELLALPSCRGCGRVVVLVTSAAGRPAVGSAVVVAVEDGTP